MTVFHIGDGHVILPDIPRIFLDADVGKIGCIARGVILIGIKTVDIETLGSHFSAGIFIPLAVFCRPGVIFCIRIVGPDDYFSSFRYRCLVPFNSNRGHHGLARISETSWCPVIECIPLVVDQLYTSVCIVPCIAGLKG